MEKQTPTTSMELIRQVERLGFASSSTVACSGCKAIFPNQYEHCPNCNLEKTNSI